MCSGRAQRVSRRRARSSLSDGDLITTIRAGWSMSKTLPIRQIRNRSENLGSSRASALLTDMGRSVGKQSEVERGHAREHRLKGYVQEIALTTIVEV